MDKDQSQIFNIPNCCNELCRCTICLEDKRLVRLTCNHYICQQDTDSIINNALRNRQNPICPFCKKNITDYSCNGTILWRLEETRPSRTQRRDDEEEEDWELPPRAYHREEMAPYTPADWDSDGIARWGLKSRGNQVREESLF